MHKFAIGQKVVVYGRDGVRTVEEQYIVDGVPRYGVSGLIAVYSESQLTAVADKKESDIQVKYVFDGVTFDTKEEALDHKREIQLFDMVKDIQPDYFIVGDVIRRLIANKQKVLEILK